MNKIDYSRNIYNKYFNKNGKILRITLKDNSVLEGIFVGLFHGNTEAGEPYVIKWHFIPEDKIEEYNLDSLSVEENQVLGKIIKQEDIKRVMFK